MCLTAHGGSGRMDGESETFIPILEAGARQGLRNSNRDGLGIGKAVRWLTPMEWERLQGFPDDYTLIPYRGKLAADGPRYKALGNSMAVPVIRWIGQRIAQVYKP